MAVLRMTQHIVSKICYRKTFICEGATLRPELACGQLSIELAFCRGTKIVAQGAGSLSVIYPLSWSGVVVQIGQISSAEFQNSTIVISAFFCKMHLDDI